VSTGEDGARILVVEDEAAIRHLIRLSLTEEGYEVSEAEDAFAAAQRLAAVHHDLVLLDLNLPDVGGHELLVRIRRDSDVPVIILTGRDDEADRVRALRAGADDYIVKPFSIPEFLARLEAVLRRSKGPAVPRADGLLRYGDLAIDLVTREVSVDAQAIDLTAREFDLLAFLAASPRQVFTREQILEHVWGSKGEWQDAATVTEHVRRLRRKVEKDPDAPSYLQTVRGVGYRFQA
jgi:two-component system phosphate regulon response regulator PhoB